MRNSDRIIEFQPTRPLRGATWSCLFIARAVLEHLDRRNPFLARVAQAAMLAGVILGVLPLRPDFEELLHRQQLPALQHLVDVLLPLGVGLGACEGARVALKPF